MARYRGPKLKISRKFREPIFGANDSKVLKKKNYPSGEHGKIRKKQSEYGLQLLEKQKIKYIYGLLERQFNNLCKEAMRKKGITGEIILQFLETRLDNIVYRLGITNTRRSARQLVTHKHILVDNKVVNIPSFRVKLNQKISVRNTFKPFTNSKEKMKLNPNIKYPWLTWDQTNAYGLMLSLPKKEEIPGKINERRIVEFYAKK